MENLKITLTEQEANYVLQALSTRPYGECFELIKNIQNQAAAQIEEAKTPDIKVIDK